jgi:mannosyltransferase
VQVVRHGLNRQNVALLAIVLLGLFLRLYNLGAQSIWLDEAVSVAMAKLSLSQIVATAAASDNHPPLYYFVLHYWINLFGTSEFSVRLVSVIFGTLAIPMIYAVGRLLFDKNAGLLGALILATSSFNVQYSQEARMYSLMVLLALLSMYFFVRFLRQSAALLISAGYVLFTTLLLYDHVYGFFVVLAQNIFIVILWAAREPQIRIKYWLAVQAIVLALFAPWIGALSGRAVSLEKSGFWLAPPTIGTISQTLTAYSGTVWLLILFLGLSVLSVFTYRKVLGSMDWKAPLKALERYSWEVRATNVGQVCFLLVWLLTINVAPFVISRFSTPIYLDKYTIAASVALYLLVAGGIRNLNSRYVKLAAVLIIIALSATSLQAYYTTVKKPDARDAIGAISATAKNGDVVIISPSYHEAVFDYYYEGPPVAIKPFPSQPVLTSASSGITNQNYIKEFLADANGHDRVWFVNAHESGTLPSQVLTQALEKLNKSFETTYFRSYYGYDVYLFTKRG